MLKKILLGVSVFQVLCLFSQECSPEMRFNGKKLLLTNKQWKQRLPLDEYRILREGKTEPPFRNRYNDNKKPGIYHCAACDLPLFSSKAKYDSHTGWPSFWEPICSENVSYRDDRILVFWKRIEVICSRCESHLGHLFDDGPPPTGKRYCINSLAMKFIPESE